MTHMAFRICSRPPPASEPSVAHHAFTIDDTGHPMLLAEAPIEAPGHRVALNVLRRDRLCEGLGIEPPSSSISRLGMANPQDTISPKPVPCSPAVCIPWTSRHPHPVALAGGCMSIRQRAIIAQDAERRPMFIDLTNWSSVSCRSISTPWWLPSPRRRGPRRHRQRTRPNGPACRPMSFDTHLDELEIASALHQRIHGRPRGRDDVQWHPGSQMPQCHGRPHHRRGPFRGPYVDIPAHWTMCASNLDPNRYSIIVIGRSSTFIPGEAEHKTLMGLHRRSNKRSPRPATVWMSTCPREGVDGLRRSCRSMQSAQRMPAMQFKQRSMATDR